MAAPDSPKFNLGRPVWDEFFRAEFGDPAPIIAAVIALPESQATETREPRPPAVWYTREGPYNGRRFRVIGTKVRETGPWAEIIALQPI